MINVITPRHCYVTYARISLVTGVAALWLLAKMDKPSVVRNAALSLFNRKGLAYNTTRAETVKQFVDELLRAIDTEEFQKNLYQ